MYPKKNEAAVSNDTRITVLEATILNINTTLVDIRQEMKEIRNDFQLEMKEIRNDFHQETQEIRQEMKEMRNDFHRETQEIRQEMKEIHHEIKEMRNDFRQETQELRNDFQREMKEMNVSLLQAIKHIDDKFDKKLDLVNSRLWSNFLWIMGMIITMTLTLGGLIAHAQHWI